MPPAREFEVAVRNDAQPTKNCFEISGCFNVRSPHQKRYRFWQCKRFGLKVKLLPAEQTELELDVTQSHNDQTANHLGRWLVHDR